MRPLSPSDVVRGQFRGYRNEKGVATEVLVELKHPPQAVFDASSQGQSDYFRFRLSPDVSISLGARAKLPGEAMVGERVELVVRQAPADEMTPYERLLGDAIRGDPRCSFVKTAWKPLGALSIRSWGT
jgi:glucose-6-phosphate 1-dehydrogenase